MLGCSGQGFGCRIHTWACDMRGGALLSKVEFMPAKVMAVVWQAVHTCI